MCWAARVVGTIDAFMLHDQQGVLSQMLNVFAHRQANILTINSIVPTNGCALVTISAETNNVTVPLEDLLHEIGAMPGVIKAEVLAG